MHRRRIFLASAAAIIFGRAVAQPRKVWRIGALLTIFPPDGEAPQALRQGLRELGYLEGRDVIFEWRYAEEAQARLPGLAAELVRLKVDVIITDVTPATRAAMQATQTIPIVMTNTADAVGTGLVASLARPGRNVTGITVMLSETSVKRLELFKQAVPKISRIAIYWSPEIPFHEAMKKEIAAAAPSLGVRPFFVVVKNRRDFGDALSKTVEVRADAVLVNETMSAAARKQFLAFTAERRLPAMFLNKDWVTEGGLMSYSTNYPEVFRQSAVYVDKIFKGAQPSDIPIEQPTKFEWTINLKTAKSLGLHFAPSVLARADRVIQ